MVEDDKIIPINVGGLSTPASTRTKFKARPWVIKDMLQRNTVTIISAPGGTGKSLFVTQLAACMSAGIPWESFEIEKPITVLLVNKEDERDELDLRLGAIQQLMGIELPYLCNLHIVDDPTPALLARKVNTKIESTSYVELLRREIARVKADVLILDPFVETFEADENSNSDMSQVIGILRKLAKEFNIAILLIHHTPKGIAGKVGGNQDSARGAGAIINGVRLSFSLTTMSPETSLSEFAIPEEESYRYVKLMSSKANYTEKTNLSRWFKKESIALEIEGGFEWSVGLSAWTPPSNRITLSEDMITAIIEEINQGWLDKTTWREYGRHRGKSKIPSSKWAGLIFKRLGVGGDTGISDGLIKGLLDEWLREGKIFAKEDCKDSKGNDYAGYRILRIKIDKLI